MTKKSPETEMTNQARSLRRNQTRSEGLLWSMLRARQLCGLKFRRQHPIGPWIADFACVDRMLVVEIDGEYHDKTIDKDIQCQNDLQRLGWTVIRFSAEDVENDAESVGRAIANKLGFSYEFKTRLATGSGMRSVRAPSKHTPNKQ